MADAVVKKMDIPAADLKRLDGIIDSCAGKNGALLSILEEAQKISRHSYLPEDVLEYISMKTATPLSRIYNVVTFYSFFNLKPQGEHVITICRGTACHTRGSRSLLNDIASRYGCADELEGGEASFTTSDNRITIQTVACFGQCALAPVIAVDGIIYSNVTAAKLQKLLNSLDKGGKK